MKKKIGLILCGILVICCFFGCRKTYNLNEYKEDEFTSDKYDKIKEGSIIKYKGVVGFFETGYDKNGNEVYFYRIQPIYKGSNSKYAKNTSETGKGLVVLIPIEEINKDFANFIDYLERGDIVNIKGRKVEDGKYYTSKEFIGENKEDYIWKYIKAEEIEVIGNVND